ncbi:MAG: D-alanine--D-alanine ligase [Gammaproteobacteria bacterium]
MNAQAKLQLAVLCGGQSAEHEVSVISAKNILQALDAKKYDIHVIFITKQGQWYWFDSYQLFLTTAKPQELLTTTHCYRVAVVPGKDEPLLVTLNPTPRHYQIDVVFPVLHGTYGEDGTIQGLTKLVNIPFVGADVLGSAVCMDKEISKKLLQAANIPVAKWLSFSRENAADIHFANVVEQLGLPFFVKPANTGSSVGITKVKDQAQFNSALDIALQYDHKVLLEQYIAGREIECSVLGNEFPEASLPGEIITHPQLYEFYTYEAKYLDPNGATLKVPAELSPSVVTQIQTMAKAAFKACCCTGMARVDFFLTPDGQLYVNELNTIPGFTQISMYPKMWQVSGLVYRDLLDKLIQLAFQRNTRDREMGYETLQKTITRVASMGQ